MLLLIQKVTCTYSQKQSGCPHTKWSQGEESCKIPRWQPRSGCYGRIMAKILFNENLEKGKPQISTQNGLKLEQLCDPI